MAKKASKKAAKYQANKKRSNKKKRSEVAPPVDSRLVERAVRFVNRKAHAAIEGASAALLEIGEYCLAKFFDDDPGNVQTVGGRRKRASFRALAAQPQLE